MKRVSCVLAGLLAAGSLWVLPQSATAQEHQQQLAEPVAFICFTYFNTLKGQTWERCGTVMSDGSFITFSDGLPMQHA